MKRILVIGDLHAGHRKAITPRSYLDNHANAYQKWVIDCWDEMVKKFKSPDYLILNGDLLDGPGVKNLGMEAIRTDIEEQAKMSVELLTPLVGKNTQTKVLGGSGYHIGEGFGNNGDLQVAEKLGADFVGSDYTLDIDEQRIQFAHGSGGGKMNPDTYMRQERKLALEKAQKRGERAPNILIRSHIHRYIVSGDALSTGYTAPCWQYSSRFVERMSANLTPDIGALVIDVKEGLALVYPKMFVIPQWVEEGMRVYEKVIATKKSQRKEAFDWEMIMELSKRRK